MSDEECSSSSGEEQQFEEEQHQEEGHGAHKQHKEKSMIGVMGKTLVGQAKKNKKSLGGMFGGFGKHKSANAEDGTAKQEHTSRNSFSGISSKFGGGSGGSLGGKFSSAINGMKGGHPHPDNSAAPVNNNVPIGNASPVENSAPVSNSGPPLPNR